MLQIEVPDNAPEMEFDFLIGDSSWETYGGRWISKEAFHNGDFQYWLVLEFINMLDATGDPMLLVEIDAVSPEEAGSEQLQSAVDSMGLDNDMLAQLKDDHRLQVECLHMYGIHAPLWNKEFPLTEQQVNDDDYSNLAEQAVKEARQVAPGLVGLFGFAMDGYVNRLGSTGWDFITGDAMAGLDRWRESQE